MSIPLQVRQAYGLPETDVDLAPRVIPSLINQTFLVQQNTGEPLVIQRLHPVFGAHVHLDIEAATAHLAARGLETPRLVRTVDGQYWITEHEAPNRVWRAQTHIRGRTLHHTRDARCIESAARLLARFHSALVDLTHEFVHHRPIHDTRRHLENLCLALDSERGKVDSEAQSIGRDILAQAGHVRVDYSQFPKRVIHGDPKLSNVMFDESGMHARCLIDLDTLGRAPLAHELGDALRSWCNAAGEDIAAPSVDMDTFRAVISGYASEKNAAIGDDEVLSALDGLETISLELSSRFAADAIVDSYFGWDATRFGSRREHNLVRARGQLALYRSVRQARPVLLEAARNALAAAGRDAAGRDAAGR